MRLLTPKTSAGRGALRRWCVAVVAGASAAVAVASPATAADPVQDAQWHLDYLHVDEAHRYSQGEGIVVGVIDTGVDASHPDLAGSVLPGYTVPPTVADPDTDANGHGTGMAGLIVAHGRARGVAPKAKILPVVHMQTSR